MFQDKTSYEFEDVQFPSCWKTELSFSDRQAQTEELVMYENQTQTVQHHEIECQTVEIGMHFDIYHLLIVLSLQVYDKLSI